MCTYKTCSVEYIEEKQNLPKTECVFIIESSVLKNEGKEKKIITKYPPKECVF